MKMDSGVTVELNEDCFVCDQSKLKVKPFPKNDPSLHSSNPPFWRTYCDGYGGGRKGALEGSSLGGESYEGAVGGFIFACSSTGTLRRKLYATTTQFPAILYQFLQDVERQHFMCKELYVDTYSVNLSKEAEDVAAMFRCRICPISAGTPQELAFAESGVRNVGKISRSMLLGAKHLPSWAWGLADGYATYVHDVLPQRRRGYKSPYELRNGKKPNLDLLFIKCFGAACQYAPMEGAEHNRGKISEWGWFLGMEWPFVLVGTKVDNWKDCKVLNCSRKKVKVYEGAYAFFDPLSSESPNFKENMEIDVNGFYKPVNDESSSKSSVTINEVDDLNFVPDSVASVKNLRANTMN